MSAQAVLQVKEDKTRLHSFERVQIGHVQVDKCSLEEAIACVIRHAESKGRAAYVVTPNAQHIVLLERDMKLRQIYNEADLVTADGASLLLASGFLGNKLSQRVCGVDLFQRLCERAADSKLRVFLLGGRPGSADQAAAILTSRSPGLQVETLCPPFGFEQNDYELTKVRAAILAAKPDLLFVALGAPKQEYWIYNWGRDLGVPVLMGIGGSFEMVSGIVRRAPQWMQRMGGEWVHRLIMEPRRMWRRYLIGNLQFAAIVVSQSFRAWARTSQ